MAELREVRIQGLQTLRELIERRLAPAMNTCRTVRRGGALLSARVARATALLPPGRHQRERQNQELLESMNRRAAAAAPPAGDGGGPLGRGVTYYVVGLVGYVARASRRAGPSSTPIW